MISLALSAFSQRLLNIEDSNVRAGMNPVRLSDLRGMLDTCVFEAEPERKRCLRELEATLADMQPVATDRHGFKTVVAEANVAFLKPSYIKMLAEKGGPFPRRQDLKPAGLYMGVLPPGRIFSVSHGWASEFHPSPRGLTMRRLAAKLAKLGAQRCE